MAGLTQAASPATCGSSTNRAVLPYTRVRGRGRASMNEPSNRVSEISELKELVRLLGTLLEAAQRLPQGAERQAAFEQISDFQRRLAALIRQSSEAH